MTGSPAPVGRTLTAPEEAVLVGDHGLICDQVLFATTRSRADLAVVQVVEWVLWLSLRKAFPDRTERHAVKQHSIQMW